MAEREHESLVQSWMRAFNERNNAMLDGLLSPAPKANVPDHSSRGAICRWLADLHDALPQDALRFAEDQGFWEKLAERWTSYNLPRQTAVSEASGTLTIRIAEGKAVDGWFVEDRSAKATPSPSTEGRARTASG